MAIISPVFSVLPPLGIDIHVKILSSVCTERICDLFWFCAKKWQRNFRQIQPISLQRNILKCKVQIFKTWWLCKSQTLKLSQDHNSQRMIVISICIHLYFCSIALFWDLPALPCEYVECINWGEYTSLLYHARHQHTMEHASVTTDIALI